LYNRKALGSIVQIYLSSSLDGEQRICMIWRKLAVSSFRGAILSSVQ